MESKLMPLRYTAPTKYDKAPHTSICPVSSDSGVSYYVQMSQDEHSDWIKIGDLFHIVFLEGAKSLSPQKMSLFVEACVEFLLCEMHQKHIHLENMINYLKD